MMRFETSDPNPSLLRPNPQRLNELYDELLKIADKVNNFSVLTNPGRVFSISIMRVTNTKKTGPTSFAPIVMTELMVETFERSYIFSTAALPIVVNRKNGYSDEYRTLPTDRDAYAELLEYVRELLVEIKKGFAEKCESLTKSCAVLRRTV